ncbi:MAG: glycosyltransferase family 39 protein [Bdellovibrionales bacterium]|nr:glycosyltransferase family 39 protein [Bdellovibrionales bacterium]
MTRSLADQRQFEIDSYCNLPGAGERRFFEFTGDRAYFNNHFYSTRAPLGPILGIPAYLTYRTYYMLRYGHNVVGHGFPEKFLPSVYFWVTASTSCLFGALLTVLIFDFSRHFLRNTNSRIFAALLFSFGTLIFNFSTVAFPHTPSAFFVFVSFYLLYELQSPTGCMRLKNKPNLSAFFSAAAFGCAVLHHYLVATMGPAFLMYVLMSEHRRKLIFPWLLGAAITASLFGAYNYEIFKTPFDWTQNHEDSQIFSRGSDEPLTQQTKTLIKKIPRIEWTISDRLIQVFKRVAKRRMFLRATRLMIYPYRGLLLYNPLLIFAFVGLFILCHTNFKSALAILFAFGLTLFFNALHTDWWGGGSFGPRFLVPTIPLLFVGLLEFLRWVRTARNRKVWTAIFGFVLLFNCVTIWSGLRDWVYHVGQPLDSNAQIMMNALKTHQQLMLEFSLPKSPLFTTYVPGLFSDGVKSVVLEGMQGSSWSFPNNVLYLVGVLTLIWLPFNRLTLKNLKGVRG